jgi:tetratricopeptide (TPR) repeat protein
MTLGRAYMDTGEWARARAEFEQALKGAPDNILASRFLAECLEHLGETAAALARYKATLVLAPGDKQVIARIGALESKAPAAGAPAPSPAVPGRPVPPAPAAPPAPPGPSPAAEPPPIPLVAVDTPMELEGLRDGGGFTPVRPPAPPPPPRAAAPVPEPEPVPAEPPPIPVSTADEEFELERPYEAPTAAWSAPPLPPPSPAAAPPEPRAVSEAMTEFDFDAGPPAPPPPPPPAPMAAEPVIEADVEAEVEPEPAPAPVPEAPPAAPDLTSPTLAELYFNQGFTDKAIQVYRQILERDPGNPRLEARLRELEAVARHLGDPSPAAAPDEGALSAGAAAAARRQVLERTIARLEGFLAAIRRE